MIAEAIGIGTVVGFLVIGVLRRLGLRMDRIWREVRSVLMLQ
jgi:hypothetical protein